MNATPEQISQDFVRLLPLVYNKLASSPKKASSLTHLQIHILEEMMHAREGISVTHLAQRIRISKQQLTPLIHKLEEHEFVSKSQNLEDKRSVKLMLTEKGTTEVMKHWEGFQQLLSSRIGQLDEDDLLDLDFAINKIIRIFAKLD